MSRSFPLGLVLSTVTAGAPQAFVGLGQLAEDHGFEAVFVNEGKGDALACAQAIAAATTRLLVGTNIANIYFRHPFLAAASVRTTVDGRERQNYPLSDMFFAPLELVARLSHDVTLEPGDVILCGTSVGVLPMKPGARVEVSIDGIGTLSNLYAPATA